MSSVSLKTEVFGKFILLDKMAMGGMAEVYRAKAPGAEGIGKIIALKRILPQYTANNDFIEMFKDEAKIAINLTHGNIAQIYEFGEEHRQFYLAMEFIDGRNLRQVLSRCTKLQKALTIEQCVYVMAQVANGLDYAHRCTDKNTGRPLTIIHRDMSPQNIMLSYEGEIKIIDFGIAKAESKIESTRAGTLKGKFGYMSPEQAEGAELDARTDIFSAGIVLWELLSGERLFVASSEVNTIRKIRECHIPSLRKINPNINEELERITSRALAKDRSLRYQTAADLYRDLSRYLYKVNPEFTQHELGLFVKTLFKEDILEDRKKVSEFAKINFLSITGRDEKGHHDSTKSYTETSNVTSAISPPKIGSTTDQSGAPKNLINESQINREINISFNDFDKLEIARKSGSNAQTGPQIPRSAFGPLTSQTMTNITQSRITRQVTIMSRWLPVLLFIGAVAIGSYAFLHDPGRFIKLGSDMLGSSSPNDVKVPPLRVDALLETAHVFISSIPAGAQIEIDRKIVGTTPAEITLPLYKKVALSLWRDGYVKYTKEFIATKTPEDFGPIALQKAIQGYLNIEVIPPYADIYINGQKVADRGPVKRIAVPAGTPIQVKAVNNLSRISDEVVVTVRQDTVVPVRLFLKKSK